MAPPLISRNPRVRCMPAEDLGLATPWVTAVVYMSSTWFNWNEHPRAKENVAGVDNIIVASTQPRKHKTRPHIESKEKDPSQQPYRSKWNTSKGFQVKHPHTLMLTIPVKLWLQSSLSYDWKHNTNIHACVCTCTHKTHSCTRSLTHSYKHTHPHSLTHTCSYTLTHILTHTHSHSLILTHTPSHTLTLTCSIKVPHTESLLPSRGQEALLQVSLLSENILGPTASTLFQIPSHSHYTGDKGKKKHRVINKL